MSEVYSTGDLPVLALRGLAVFPDQTVHFEVGRRKSVLALDEAMKGFTDAQYAALRALVADICRRHEIPMDKNHVIGHDAYNPEKTDPGSLFDWDRVLP